MASPTRQPSGANQQNGQPAEPHKNLWPVLIIAIMIVAIVLAWGLISRHRQAVAVAAATEDAAIPTVTLTNASAEPATEAIVLQGNVQAYYEAPIYARTNGYVQAWYTDIGTRVKAGQLLALLDTPDVNDELHQAVAQLATAKANSQLADVTAHRWLVLRQTNSVSQQETDQQVSNAAAQRANVASAQANVERLQQLQDFRRVVAPFDGVVTARLTDIGALITNGTSTILFRVADTSQLRIYTEVPEPYVADMTEGGGVDLTFAEYPTRTFRATVARTSNALDPTSRTLMVELHLNNAQGTLLPGGYAQVHFLAKSAGGYARVPVSALLFRADGLHVATLASRWQETPKGSKHAETRGRIALKTVTIGRDFGTSLEITTGISPGESIIADPPDSATDGETVRLDDAAARTNSSGTNS